jgi:aminoglycoside phosphotransferase (APT) family kinase protein
VPAVDRTVEPETLRLVLEPWLAAQFAAADLRITDCRVPKQGYSNETAIVDAAWTAASGATGGSFVVRMQPADSQIFLGGDVRLQFVMTSAARRHGVAAPVCRWFEPDSAVLGTPFYVMDAVTGRTPADVPSYNTGGWVAELDVDQRAALWRNAMAQLARIHQLDHRHDDFALLHDRSGGRRGLDVVLGHLEAWCRSALIGRRHATIDPAMAWLHEHRPPDEPPIGVSWGDARIGNMIFDDDLDVAAVTDWEMASLAPAEVDVGWWLFLDEWSAAAQGEVRLPGLPDPATTIAHHERALGRPLHDLHWYEVLAGTRYAVAMVRMGDLLARSGLMPDDRFVHVNPVLSMLAARLDLPEPARPG